MPDDVNVSSHYLVVLILKHAMLYRLLAIFHMKHKNMKHKSIQGVYYVSGMRQNSQGVLVINQLIILTVVSNYHFF